MMKSTYPLRKKQRVIVNVKMYTKNQNDSVVPIHIDEEWKDGDKFVYVCKLLTTLPGSHLKILKLQQQNVYTIKGSLYYDTNEKPEDKFWKGGFLLSQSALFMAEILI